MQRRVEIIIKEFSLNAEPQTVYKYWLDAAVKYYESQFKIKPFMLETLKKLHSLGVKSAIATASDRRCAQAFITSNCLNGYISSVTSLDEVDRPKSFPDIYIKAAEKIGVKPLSGIVFEDALTAIKSAKIGGFKVCGVQDDCSADDEKQIKEISDITLGF